MKYSKCNDFKNTTATVQELLEALKDNKERGEYPCYIAHVDSIYPITGFSLGILGNDIASLSSKNNNEETSEEPITLLQLLSEVESLLSDSLEYGSFPVFAEAAQDIDETLDMQLDEACAVRQWALTEHAFLKDFYIVTGLPMDYY